MKRCILLLILLSGHALAQQELEIIPLQHRTLEQILPVVTPFVERGGAVSGMNDRLIIRSSRRNIEEIKALLASLDTPPKRLRITVSNDMAGESASQDAGVSGRIEIGGHDGTRIHGYLSESARMEARHVNQTLQVMEGSSGYIVVGQSLPVPLRQVVLNPQGIVVTDTVVYRDIGSGFYVTPRLNGETVTLSITPQLETPGRAGPGSTDLQRISTTVSGKLGEWIGLGGGTISEDRQGRGYTSYSSRNRQETRRVWLKVEEEVR